MASWTTEHLAPSTLPNSKVPWTTIEEEPRYREMFAEAHPRGLLGQPIPLPQKLERISDPLRPGSVRHKRTVFVHGTRLFILQMASRLERTANLAGPGCWRRRMRCSPSSRSKPPRIWTR